MADPASRRRVSAVWRAAMLVGVLAALWLGGARSGAAQSPSGDPAFVTLINLTPSARTVDVRHLPAGTRDRHRVPGEEEFTFSVDAGADPVDMTARCRGCHPVRFAVAAGQRLVVLLVSVEDPAITRADLRIVNQGDGQRRGVVRTGAVPGGGRTLVPFDLGAGEEVHVGLRTAGAVIDLNLTCFGCGGQRIRVTDAVDLEVAIE
jgi:hypothetical protein